MDVLNNQYKRATDWINTPISENEQDVQSIVKTYGGASATKEYLEDLVQRHNVQIIDDKHAELIVEEGIKKVKILITINQ